MISQDAPATIDELRRVAERNRLTARNLRRMMGDFGLRLSSSKASGKTMDDFATLARMAQSLEEDGVTIERGLKALR